ncbi:MAG: hypothetical protein RLZZ602_259 [Pseudomonadota bacterium]
MTDVTPCNSRVYRLAVSGTAAELDPTQCAFEIQKHVHRYAKGYEVCVIAGLSNSLDDLVANVARDCGLKTLRLGPAAQQGSKRAVFACNERIVALSNGLLLFTGTTDFATRHLLDAAYFRELDISITAPTSVPANHYLTECA